MLTDFTPLTIDQTKTNKLSRNMRQTANMCLKYKVQLETCFSHVIHEDFVVLVYSVTVWISAFT
jgi:hypothetical protein